MKSKTVYTSAKSVLLGVVTTIAAVSSEAQTYVVPFLSQLDAKWKSETLGGDAKETIGNSGCALTSVAMALASAGASVNPKTLNAFLVKNGGFTPGVGLNWAPVADFDGKGGLVWSGTGKIGTAAELKRNLDGGVRVVAKSNRWEAKGRPHWVIIAGYTGKGTSLVNFTYLDPADSSKNLRKVGDGWVGAESATRLYMNLPKR